MNILPLPTISFTCYHFFPYIINAYTLKLLSVMHSVNLCLYDTEDNFI